MAALGSRSGRLAPGFLAALSLALVTCGARGNNQAPATTEDFDVRPGGQVHAFSRSMGGFTCTFTYAAQGGTNEQWQMSVSTFEDGDIIFFSCSIWRPQGKSYLFFTQFTAEVTGAMIDFGEAYSQAASSGHRDIPLKREEYEVSKTAVTHKQGVFGSALSKVVIVAQSHHDEL